MAKKGKTYDTGGSQLNAVIEMMRGFFPVIAVGLIIVIGLSLYFVNKDVVDPGIFLNQTPTNYYNATAKVLKKDEVRVLQHLNDIKQELPTYMKQYVVKDADSIAVTVTVKYAVDTQALEDIYYKDSKEYKAIKQLLIDQGYELE